MILRVFSLIIVLFLIASCSQKRAAPVSLKGHLNYYKNNYKPKYSAKKYGKTPSVITIESGDNLYDISRRYNVSMRDLIDQNNLTPPYILMVGRKLKLPSAKYHTVVEGDNLYKISRLYGMNVNDLISINDLSAPYNIMTGSRLKISRSSYGLKKSAKVQERNLSSSSRSAKTSSAKLPYKNNKFIWPVKGEVISTFGQKAGGLYNDGVNIKAPALTPVKSIEDGLVAYVGNELRGYGNLVIVKHSGGWISAYAHLQKAKVKMGDKVSKGNVIASVGSTGNVNFPQLYFGIRKNRDAVNPQNYLK